MHHRAASKLGLPFIAVAALVSMSCAGSLTTSGVTATTGDAGTSPADAGTSPADAGTSHARTADAGTTDAGTVTPVGATLHVQGRQLYDTCGNPLVIRGVEQRYGQGIDVNGSWLDLTDQIAASGANAVRVLPDLSQLSTADVDSILGRAVGDGLVVFLSPGDRSWFLRSDVEAMLAKYQASLILDAFQEPNYDNRSQWETDVTAAIQQMRGAGYPEPLCVLANLYGRDLPVVLDRGQAVEDSDPLHNTILGWQAYWGQSGYYQGKYGMTLTQAMQQVDQAAFPIQVGILNQADPGDMMDYATVMALAQQYGVGWLWWDWYNPFGGTVYNLSADGTAGNLSSVGHQVVDTLPDNMSQTAAKACPPH